MISFFLLGAAIVAVWAPPLPLRPLLVIPAWLPVFVAAIVAGAVEGVLDAPAVVALTVLVGCAFGSLVARSPMGRGSLAFAAAVVALALALHRVPGFHNPVHLAGVLVSADGVPFTHYLNFDKGAAGLVLLAAYARRGAGWDVGLVLEPARTWPRLRGTVTNRAAGWPRPAVERAVLVGAATLLVVFVAAFAAGHLRLDPKLPAYGAPFLAANLLFTCVAEEAFFRGLLQERITRALWTRVPASVAVAIAITFSALLFGAAHLGGGLGFATLATVAGVGYAAVYAATRRIEAAVLTHFALNAVHFLGFTYPSLAR